MQFIFSRHEKFEKCVLGFTNKNSQGINKSITRLKRLIEEDTAIVKLQVLGIIRKMLSGSWMSTFYTNLNAQKVLIDTMQVIKDVIPNPKL